VIDLHSHVLPTIDDGPREMSGAVELARAAAADGVEVLAATPHLRADFPLVRAHELADRCEALRASLDTGAGAPQIVAGAEVDLGWAIDATDEELRLATIGQTGEYVLVETPYGQLFDNFEEALFHHVRLRGPSLILAHPERNPSFQRDPGRLARLVERGVLVQITAPALVPRRRGGSRKLALALIERGLAHLLASDAHSAAGGRPAGLSGAVAEAARVAPARARWMVTDAPAAVLAGEPLPPPPEETRRPRRGLGRR